MTKRSYSTLRAKLQELESKLGHVLLLPPEIQSHQSHSQDIKQKFAFIRNLLSAEVASNPPKPHHLEHIDRKLAKLEKAFSDWDSYGAFSYEESDKDSSCSCTESCFNDDGESLDDAGMDFLNALDGAATVEDEDEDEKQKDNAALQKLGSFAYVDAKEFLQTFAGDDKALVKEIKREETSDSTFGKKICGAMAGGVMVGMVFMGFLTVKFSGCFHHGEATSLRIPT